MASRLPAYLKLTWELAREPHLSRYGKGILAVGAAYSVSPIDLVPGIIPVVGQLDDLLVLLYAVRAALNRLPPELQAQYLSRHGLTSEQLLADSAVVQAALKAAAAGAARLAGRATIWGTRTVGRGLALGARGALALGREAVATWRKRRAE